MRRSNSDLASPPLAASAAAPDGAAAAAPADVVPVGSLSRKEKLTSGVRDQLEKMPKGSECLRCGMTQEEHTRLFEHNPHGQSLEKHHIVPIREGGHPTDPSNLLTLCHMCHGEWHQFWEHVSTWEAYMASTPYCTVIPSVGMRKEAQAAQRAQPAQRGCCYRCGVSAERCRELRPSAEPFAPFVKARGKVDHKKPMCHWCRIEWTVFWVHQRPHTKAFFQSDRFFKGPSPP